MGDSDRWATSLRSFDGTMGRGVWVRMCNELYHHRRSGAAPILTNAEWSVVGKVWDRNLNVLKKTLAGELERVYRKVFP